MNLGHAKNYVIDRHTLNDHELYIQVDVLSVYGQGDFSNGVLGLYPKAD